MAWTAPPVERTVQLGDLGTVTERQMLEGWLNWHRETLLAKCAGLEPAALARTTVEPSDLTLLGLVRHMAEVERWWFRRSFAGEEIGDVFTGPSDGNEGLDGVHAADAERDFGLFRAEVIACDAAAAGRDLDETFVSSRGVSLSLRWVYVLMIQEYARHNGHADFLRERTDGTTGD
ncbi:MULTISPECIES: DinB family protein [Streptomyces]|uniref:Mini-circle protein n=2 Tax=Streptomyces TaxID=1883 RepID=A0A2U9NUJ0_STRAS|nr:DinB family protein [Streptomyces actuosus]AWT40932.1 Mini-circle protein [Streptomyces actuosus]MBM4826603.1 DinB family protein [Streptomyces actuosus]